MAEIDIFRPLNIDYLTVSLVKVSESLAKITFTLCARYDPISYVINAVIN